MSFLGVFQASRVSFLGCKAAQQVRGRLFPLERFLFAFCSKNRDWHHSHLGFQVTFGIPWLHWFHYNKDNLTCVCFSDMERANLLTLCLSCHKQRFQVWNMTTSDVWIKTKACFNFELILGKEISSDGLLTNNNVPWLCWQEWNHHSETSQSEGNKASNHQQRPLQRKKEEQASDNKMTCTPLDQIMILASKRMTL